MGFIKKNLLKVIEWNDSSKDTIVYRFPVKDRYAIMNGSTLVVRPSQVAMFVYKGKVADVFEPGTYKLTTENIPFISKLLALPTAFELPVQAEVYYVNTKQFTGQKWGTQNPIILRDKEFGAIRARGYGVYSFRVIDAKVFMEQLFGTSELYTTDDVANTIRPMIIETITDAISESKLSVLDIASSYKEFGDKVVASSEKEFSPYGLKLEDLVIENISLPESVEKALDERSRLGIMEDKLGTYTQLQVADSIKEAAKNPNGNNLAGLGVGLSAGGAMGHLFNQNLTMENKPKAKTTTCIKCGVEIPEKAKHCPECGAKQGLTCPKCGESVSARAKFCANCGEKLGPQEKVCKCGEKLKPNAKFCPNCGTKAN